MLTPFKKTNIEVVNKKTHIPTEYDYYIGRPSPIGNPYTHLKSSKAAEFVVDTRDESIESYEQYMNDKINSNNTEFVSSLNEMIDIYNTYKMLNLVCWCKPKTCHGDYIKKYLDNFLFNEKVL